MEDKNPQTLRVLVYCIRTSFHLSSLENLFQNLYKNMTGQLVHKERLFGGANVLDLSGLQAGGYFFVIRDQGELVETGKQVVVRGF